MTYIHTYIHTFKYSAGLTVMDLAITAFIFRKVGLPLRSCTVRLGLQYYQLQLVCLYVCTYVYRISLLGRYLLIEVETMFLCMYVCFYVLCLNVCMYVRTYVCLYEGS